VIGSDRALQEIGEERASGGDARNVEDARVVDAVTRIASTSHCATLEESRTSLREKRTIATSAAFKVVSVSRSAASAATSDADRNRSSSFFPCASEHDELPSARAAANVTSSNVRASTGARIAAIRSAHARAPAADG
jgi:hypothetical protein